jgi:hypothetical protein
VGVVSKVLRSDLGKMLLGKPVLIQMVCTIECLIAWLALKGLVGKDLSTESSVIALFDIQTASDPGELALVSGSVVVSLQLGAVRE